MQPVIDQLSERYRISNYDLPGRGQSDWLPNTKTIHDIANQLQDELPEKAIYIGWSFGGLITISIAARYPKRVERFIGIATLPKFIETENWPGVPQPGFRAPFEEGLNKMGLEKFFTQFYDTEFDNREPKPNEYNVLVDLLQNNKNFDLDILYKGIDICDTTDLREEFKTLQCPIDLILGDKDDSVPKATHQHIKALNPNTKLHIIPGAHHFPFWTHQVEFNARLNSIL